MNFTRVPVYLLLFILLSACGSKQTDDGTQIPVPDKITTTATSEIKKAKTSENTNESIKEKDAKETVAKVNGSEITQPQLDYAMDRLLPNKLNREEREKLSGKVLDSLIDSRLIAGLEEAKLDDQEHEMLMTKLNAYREELLVKKYITENITPRPIPAENIHQYYLEHQDEFGGGVEKTFEIIQSGVNLEETERNTLLIELSKLPTIDNWSSWYSKNKHLGVSYRKATSLVGILKEPLKKLVESTDEGKTSPLLNEKRFTIVRVNKVTSIPPKPFDQVSKKIRRMLAPQALKNSIKDHLTELKKNASIEKLLPDGKSHQTN